MKTSFAFVFFVCLALLSVSSKAQITEIGMASFYADKFDGRVTASGETFDQQKYTAAHRTLPFGTLVKVTNLNNKKTVEVVINDRGPFVKERVIDLSKVAAMDLGFVKQGVAKVKVEVVKLASQQGVSQPVIPVKISKPKIEKEAPVLNEAPKPTPTVASEGLEYYNIKSQGMTPHGFGVQVASYQEAANLMKLCDELGKKTHKDIMVQVGNSNGNKLYRVIIGTFETREQAAGFLEKNKTVFPGSFIIGF